MQDASPVPSTTVRSGSIGLAVAVRIAFVAVIALILLAWFLALRKPAPGARDAAPGTETASTETASVELRAVTWPSLSIMSIDRLLHPPASTDVLRPDAPSLEGGELGASTEQINLARFIAQKYRLSIAETRRYVEYAFQAANEHSLDPMLILAVMSVESSFNPRARSPKGAKGLMQVLARLHAEKFEPYGGLSRVYDPLVNIRVGARILSHYIERDGSVRAALKSYVGAALLNHDYGYGRKVLRERARLEAVAAAGGLRAASPRAPIASRENAAKLPGAKSAEPIVEPADAHELAVRHRSDAADADPVVSGSAKTRAKL